MSIGTEIADQFAEQVSTVKVSKTDLNGEDATEVCVGLVDGRTVIGTFTKNPRAGFGGVEGGKPKNVAQLMIAKIQSVLDNTYERNEYARD